MKDIEQVRMLVSLKGKRIWLKGEILNAPFHPEILQEIKQNPDSVEILERTKPPQPAQGQKSEKVKEANVKIGRVLNKRQLLSRRK